MRCQGRRREETRLASLLLQQFPDLLCDLIGFTDFGQRQFARAVNDAGIRDGDDNVDTERAKIRLHQAKDILRVAKVVTFFKRKRCLLRIGFRHCVH